ncbi:MAG: L,D-transpeptidase [Methylococcales bacterium]|nr:L,D-transpeptidase [Methylococcales bacterium]
MLRFSIPILLCLIFFIRPVVAMPFWGDTASRPAETAPFMLNPGQFIWKGDAVPYGPIVVVVSLLEQKAYVYRNGIRIGVSTASTGKAGHNTPTGVFMVLQKDKEHRSKTYNNAAMPYTERLTWDGVALHAGGLPGYPSSHGCIHLPSEFARRLFDASPMGMTVVIASHQNDPTEVVHPAALAPVDAKKGKVVKVPRLTPAEEFRWQPEKATAGPISIVMSGADRRVLVYRNGVEIGRSKLAIAKSKQAVGTHAYIMQEGLGIGTSPILKDAPAHRWLAVGIPGHLGEHGQTLNPDQFGGIQLPPRFAQALYDSLTPGTTLLVTDAPVIEQQTTGIALNIMNSDRPEATDPKHRYVHAL